MTSNIIDQSGSRVVSGAVIDEAIATIAAEYHKIKAVEDVLQQQAHGEGRLRNAQSASRALDWRLLTLKLQNALLKPDATNDVVSIEDAIADCHSAVVSRYGED